jgi:large subunit ribosomal protein L17
MRHRVAGRQLSRTTAHRRALRRNLAASLIEHETISTTVEKAKEIRPFVERLITLAKKGALQNRRRAIALLGNRNIIDYEDGKAVKKGSVIGKLFSELGPRYLDRPGGYTRIIRLSLRRLGDNGQLALLQLLGKDEPLKKKTKAAAKGRARRKKRKAAGVPAVTQAESTSEAKETAATEVVPESAPAGKAEGDPEAKQAVAGKQDTARKSGGPRKKR